MWFLFLFFQIAFADLKNLVDENLLRYLQGGCAVLDIDLSLDDIWNDGNGFNNLDDHLRFFDRVIACLIAEQLGLEANEICLFLLDICQHLISIMFACITIRIFSLRQ